MRATYEGDLDKTMSLIIPSAVATDHELLTTCIRSQHHCNYGSIYRTMDQLKALMKPELSTG